MGQCPQQLAQLRCQGLRVVDHEERGRRPLPVAWLLRGVELPQHRAGEQARLPIREPFSDPQQEFKGQAGLAGAGPSYDEPGGDAFLALDPSPERREIPLARHQARRLMLGLQEIEPFLRRVRDPEPLDREPGDGKVEPSFQAAQGVQHLARRFVAALDLGVQHEQGDLDLAHVCPQRFLSLDDGTHLRIEADREAHQLAQLRRKPLERAEIRRGCQFLLRGQDVTHGVGHVDAKGLRPLFEMLAKEQAVGLFECDGRSPGLHRPAAPDEIGEAFGAGVFLGFELCPLEKMLRQYTAKAALPAAEAFPDLLLVQDELVMPSLEAVTDDGLLQGFNPLAMGIGSRLRDRAELAGPDVVEDGGEPWFARVQPAGLFEQEGGARCA